MLFDFHAKWIKLLKFNVGRIMKRLSCDDLSCRDVRRYDSSKVRRQHGSTLAITASNVQGRVQLSFILCKVTREKKTKSCTFLPKIDLPFPLGIE